MNTDRIEPMTHSNLLVFEREQVLNRTLVAVCEVTGIPAHQIKARCRERPTSDARKAFIYFVKTEHGSFFTLNEIGKFILKDHATVLHNYRTSVDLLSTDASFKRLVSKISERLNINNSLPMSKEQRFDALSFISGRIEELKLWLNEHPDNPYREKIVADLRALEKERISLESVNKKSNIS